MFSASISVVFTVSPPACIMKGRPSVSARFWSKSLKELVSVRKVQIVIEGITLGMVTRHSVCHFVAPSILAASSISSGTDCKPAMYIIII